MEKKTFIVHLTGGVDDKHLHYCEVLMKMLNNILGEKNEFIVLPSSGLYTTIRKLKEDE